MAQAMTRRKNRVLQERMPVQFDFSAVTTTSTFEFFPTHQQTFLVENADLISWTGLAVSDTDYVVVTLQDGATVMATWSTKTTGGNGALTAHTFKAMALSAVSGALDAAAGDVLKLVFTVTGTPTLPAGRLVVHGRYL